MRLGTLFMSWLHHKDERPLQLLLHHACTAETTAAMAELLEFVAAAKVCARWVDSLARGVQHARKRNQDCETVFKVH